MLSRSSPMDRVGTLTLVTVALLASACGDPTSLTNAPSLPTQSIGSSSAYVTGFAVLANTSAACTDGNISGAVGTFRAPPVGKVSLTNCPMIGTVHIGDQLAQQTVYTLMSVYGAMTPRAGGSSARR